MHPIAKPVLPVMPYTGVSEYGIHRILRKHQKGGMGQILVAYDPYLKREVALKELHSSVAEEESIVLRFIGEAEITAQLEHPGVVPIYRLDLGEEGFPYYTMKMIRGETLQDVIKKYHRTPNRAELMNLIRRLVSVSKTIAFAHSKGVIHRDLKPANVMLGEYGETLVMDWGLAKFYNSRMEDSYISIVHRMKQSRPELTMVGSIVGTPAFLSPEQAMAEEGAVGPLADVFSLGTVLYYLLAGQTAFSGRSTQEVLDKVRACNPTPPSHIKPNVPHGLEAICLKAMEKLPENRYQGASEFADDLCRWLDDEPIAAEKPSFWTKIRWWMTHHRALAISIPSVVILSLMFSGAGVWLIEQNRNNVEPDKKNEKRVDIPKNEATEQE
jgi:serine/threonine protein kinase